MKCPHCLLFLCYSKVDKVANENGETSLMSMNSAIIRKLSVSLSEESDPKSTRAQFTTCHALPSAGALPETDCGFVYAEREFVVT